MTLDNNDIVIRYNVCDFYDRTSNTCCSSEYTRIQLLMKKIYDSHECFSDSYKYTPIKFIQPLRKQLFEKNSTTKTDKFTMQILNKITLSNFSKLCNILKKNTDDTNVSDHVSIILKYSKYSDTFSKELLTMLESLYTSGTCPMKKQILIEIHEFIGNFLEDLNTHKEVTDIKVESYNDFCDNNIQKKFKKNMMTMIIHTIESSVLNHRISYNIEQIIQVLLDRIIYDLSSDVSQDMNIIGIYIEYMYIISKTVTSTHILKNMRNDLNFVFDKSVKEILPKQILFRMLDINEILGKI